MSITEIERFSDNCVFSICYDNTKYRNEDIWRKNNMAVKFDLEQALDDVSNGKAMSQVYFPEVEIVNQNPDNPYLEAEDEEEIAGLAENIERHGIMQEATVFRNKGKLYLISGNKRLKALKKLIEENKRYKYRGKDITGSIPVTFTTKPSNKDEMVLNLIAVNSHRDMSKEQKERILDEVIAAFDNLAAKGQFEWPTGRKRDFLSAETGIANHFVKDYLAAKNLKARLAAVGEEEKAEIIRQRE